MTRGRQFFHQIEMMPWYPNRKSLRERQPENQSLAEPRKTIYALSHGLLTIRGNDWKQLWHQCYSHFKKISIPTRNKQRQGNFLEISFHLLNEESKEQKWVHNRNKIPPQNGDIWRELQLDVCQQEGRSNFTKEHAYFPILIFSPLFMYRQKRKWTNFLASLFVFPCLIISTIK